MALHLHRAERTDLLADGLAELLSTPLSDPFEREVVVVPAKGIERWVAQRMSHRLGTGGRGGDGVCAGVRFLSPHSLVSMLLDRERDDPWEPDQLVWPLLEVIDSSLDEPWAAALATHLGHGQTGDDAELRQNRRWSVARRVAGLFASYARQRPQLVTDWREGRDTDGAGGELAADLRWQPELWRRLVAGLGIPTPEERHAETVSRLKQGGDGLDLPGRLSLFGHTRLPITEIRLVHALGRLRDVHLWLPQASPSLWDDLAANLAPGPVRRRDDESARFVGHPLLASLGRDARELQRSLLGVVDHDVAVSSPPEPPTTLLGHLQADLRANHAPTPAERATRTLAPDDRSVQVHACHGSHRQIDVLREVLVGLLQDRPDLEPRDILVMCPDVETYAPLIEAGFGLGEVVADAHPAHGLRVRLADRALSATNPLLALATRLVELAGGRITATEVLDLVAREVVRRRFHLDDDDLSRIAHWIGESGVRWGLDQEQRAAFAMEGFGHNTWRAGIDRILVGVAMSGDDLRHLGTALPLDDVGSNDIALAGRLAELCDRLARCVTSLGTASTVDEWVAAVGDAVRSLGDVPPDDAWQVAQFERELARTLDAAGGTGSVLRLADVRALLASRLAGRPTRANFRTGTLTVCTMVPMRSVPHRVVCLVGLDDTVFPRTQWTDGDDVLARDPLTGERDVRSEDRQLLLDAVLAARDTLVVCYTGAAEHSGAVRPPAVPLGELIDAVEATADGVDVVVRHPLQAHDPRNLEADRLGTPDPFSFDRAALAGARAAVGERAPAPPFLDRPLPPPPPGDVNLADLTRFLLHPVREFLRGPMALATALEADEVHDRIPIDLDGLERWAIGDRLVTSLLDGADAESVLLAEQLRGTVPPGRMGREALEAICVDVQGLLDETAELRQGEPRTVDVDVDLGGGRRLTGTVSGIYGNALVAIGYSRLGPKHRLTRWVDLLAVSAAFPDESWSAHTVGRGRGGPSRALVKPLDHRAAIWLADLVALYDAGRTRPLPAPLKTACRWAEARAAELLGNPTSPLTAAEREWTTDPHNTYGITGEDADPWHVKAFGASAPLSDLLAAGLGDLAWRIWEPLVTGQERVGPL
ncbi:exodeoxyribonuclease V subunit gamma [Nocardioides sp.]|uniref:exodeoxyribonuclease V subunit gamma n=1 Tax=Nocardioides sp. TaxID=35761 RepID=UPI002ED51473